jgi:hypothetical protein
MKKKIFKGLLIFLAGFILFFGFRLMYGYMRYGSDGTDRYSYMQVSEQSVYYESGDGYTRQNIASSKYKEKGTYKGPEAVQHAPADQKYEKVGTLSSETKNFEETENKVRGLITQYDGLVQYEKKSGLSGQRSLNLVAGVPPDNFDVMITALKELGSLRSIQIDKTDKTNEYLELEAQRVSLEKTIASLSSLKTKSGKIDEFVNLEQQILQYERQLQELGVRLGDFDQANEFCTVRYNLREQQNLQAGIPFFKRVMVALEWTIKYYLLFAFIIAFASLASFLIIKIAQALKWIAKPPDHRA